MRIRTFGMGVLMAAALLVGAGVVASPPAFEVVGGPQEAFEQAVALPAHPGSPLRGDPG